jgi:hypothetical protein
MIYFVVPRDQEFGILDYMETWGRNLEGLLSVVHYEELPQRRSVLPGVYIFSALDQLTPGGIQLVSELQAQLRASPAVPRVLNDPNVALPRLKLLEELHRQGLNRHRAVRATGSLVGLSFPVFLHEDYRHTGSLSPLLHSHTELEGALGQALLRGYRLEELLVVEFCDTRDAEGRYRKYTAYVVGSEVIARTMARGPAWMLKAEGVDFSEEMLLEERAYVLANPYEDQLRRIFALAGVQYGRIDFAIKGGTVETWEINTNPTVGPSRQKVMPDKFAPMRQPIRDHFSRRFHAALMKLNSQASQAPIPVSFSADRLRAASPVVFPPRREGTLQRVSRALRPMRPLLDPAVRILSPLVARAARRLK